MQSALEKDASNIIFFNNEDLMVNSRYRMKMYKNPIDEIKMILELLYLNLPFAFSRYGDREYSLMKGMMVPNAQESAKENWFWDKDQPGEMSKYLIHTLEAPQGLYFYGLPVHENGQGYTKEIIQMSNYSITDRLTSFHMLFHGDAFDLFKKKFLKPVLLGASFGRPFVFVINQKYGAHEELFRDILANIFYVPDDVANFFEDNDNRNMIKNQIMHFCKTYSTTTFLISAGPLSEIIIRKMWECNPYNQYLDIGQTLSNTLDQFIINQSDF